MNVSFFLLVHTVHLSPSLLPITVGSLYIFLYFTFQSLNFFLNCVTKLTNSVRILITSVLNCASYRLAISLLLSSIFGVLICSFTWAVFFVCQHACYIVRGGALDICQGRATHITVGEGSKRELCCLFSSWPAFSHFLRYIQANCALLVLISRWVGLCTF